MFENIADHLPHMAASRPYQRAIIITSGRDKHGRMLHSHMNYQDLDADSTAMARALLAEGFRQGDRVALMVPPSFELFIFAFSLFKAGLVPVFIDPGLGLTQLKKCLFRARPQHFIGIPKAHLARTILGWNRGRWSQLVTVGDTATWGRHSSQQLLQKGRLLTTALPKLRHQDSAAVLFTSGSTGAPKGALYKHENFCAQVEALKKAFGISPGEIDLCTFPLFALFAPALGMTAVIPEMDFTHPARVNPEKIFAAIKTFGVENIFGSPALLKRVAAAAEESQHFFPSIKRVISAGAPVSPEVMSRLSKSLKKDTPIYTPYGATESLPVAITSSLNILGGTELSSQQGAGVCVGAPVDSIEVKIIRISDDPITQWSERLTLPAGEKGEIVVSGPMVSSSYYNHSEANELAKIYDKTNQRIFHRMGDIGYLDEKGQLWFCGRKSHRVQLAEGPLFTVPGEAIINSHQEVARSAIVGVGPHQARKAVLCVETRAPLNKGRKGILRKELQDLCRQFPQTKDVETILFHKDFPVDIRHNSKIFREKLSQWAQSKLN